MPVKNKKHPTNDNYFGELVGLTEDEKKVLQDAGISGGSNIIRKETTMNEDESIDSISLTEDEINDIKEGTPILLTINSTTVSYVVLLSSSYVNLAETYELSLASGYVYFNLLGINLTAIVLYPSGQITMTDLYPSIADFGYTFFYGQSDGQLHQSTITGPSETSLLTYTYDSNLKSKLRLSWKPLSELGISTTSLDDYNELTIDTHLQVNGSMEVKGSALFNGVVEVPTPTTSGQVANKEYVDNKVITLYKHSLTIKLSEGNAYVNIFMLSSSQESIDTYAKLINAIGDSHNGSNKAISCNGFGKQLNYVEVYNGIYVNSDIIYLSGVRISSGSLIERQLDETNDIIIDVVETF